MGIFWSRTKSKKSSKETLEDLENQIREAKRKRQQNLNSEKSFTAFLLLASCVIYLIALVLFYFYFFPTTLLERLINTSPLIVFPFIIYAVKRLMGTLFAQRKEKIENTLKDLFNEKNKILDEVKENEPYKVAMELLQKYDPRQVMVKPAASQQPPQPMVKGGPGTELRQRQSAAVKTSAASSPQLTSRPANVPPQSIPGSPAVQPSNSSQSLLSPSPSSEGVLIPPGMGVGSAPGPPLPLRNVVPQERSTFDKFLDYVVGDGPGQRYALICTTCFAHNGMALKDEFEYITFRCAYCFHINPARKRRQSAPKLMKTPSMDRLEKTPFASVQETNENQENTSSSTSSPLTSPTKETPSQDQLLIPDKVEEKAEEQPENVEEQPT